jgi:hypothetical protein
MKKRVFPLSLLIALLVSLITPAISIAESTNRNEVRANLAKGGWSVVYGDLINEADYALFIAAVAAAVACECPTPITEYFDYQLQEQLNKIQNTAPDIAQAALYSLLIQAFNSKGQTLRHGRLEVSADLATYRRWEEIIYDEPRTYECWYKIGPVKTKGVCTKTERVKKVIPYPNNFQPYFRFRWVASSGSNPGSAQPSGLNEVWRSGIPQAASERVSELYLSGKVIKQIAFTSDGGWVILYNKNEASWKDIPQSASDKIRELNGAGVELKQIAFTSDGGWVILYNKNEAWWNGIPQSASDKIRELNGAGVELKQIAFAPTGGWVILYNKNEAWWNDIPQSAIDKIRELNGAGSVLKQIAFTPDNGWMIFFDYNGAWAKGIPQAGFDRVVGLQQGRYELKQVAFSNTGGTVLIYR